MINLYLRKPAITYMLIDNIKPLNYFLSQTVDYQMDILPWDKKTSLDKIITLVQPNKYYVDNLITIDN